MNSEKLNKNESNHLELNESKGEYIPALKYNWLTKAYDFVLKYTMPEKAFKSKLVECADISAKQNVLDFGCGTATLSLLTKEMNSEAYVVGVDVDEQALTIARDKIEKSKADIKLIKITPGNLDFEKNTFDRVISSLVFHHLTDSQKVESLKEILRVLRPKGTLTIVDWGKASNLLMRLLFYLVQILDGFETTTSNVKGRLPEFMKEGGFKEVGILKSYNTVYGTLSVYQAKR